MISLEKLPRNPTKTHQNSSSTSKKLGAFTKIDPASALGSSLLVMHFIIQSPSDIRCKLKKAEDGPQTPLGDLVDMALKIFHA